MVKPTGLAKKRAARPLGPRNLWIILKPGTDAAAVREQIENVTFNGREVLKGMEGGVTPSVIKYTITSTPRDKGEGSDEQVVPAADPLAAAAE
jgi:hypothetical protein